ncbi:MAG: hypothetical protein WBL20_19440 [Sphingobium sp.]|uniref:hypothetical protein n=1 Tax=Sphingobium sp. TaxID=1912891 RepID=UPI003BAF4057
MSFTVGPVRARTHPATYECSACGRRESTDGALPEGWEIRAAGHLHVQICGYCIPVWENRPRYARISLANDNDTVLVVQAGEGGPRAWIAVDRAAHPDRVAAFTGHNGNTRGWRILPGVQVTHWPMPELGGAAILLAGDDGRDGVLFTADGAGLDDLIAALGRVREGLAS